MARNKYLSNKELLKEIHNSKVSYSEFTEPHYHQFDAIVENYDDMFTDEALAEAREAKAKRIATATFEEAKAEYDGPASGKPRLIDHKLDPEDLSGASVIIDVAAGLTDDS